MAKSAADRSTGAQRFVPLVPNLSSWLAVRNRMAMPLGVVGTTPRRQDSPMLT